MSSTRSTRSNTSDDSGGQLAWRGNHFERADYEAVPAPGGSGGTGGYYMMVECTLGAPETHHHFLRPDPERAGAVLSGAQPYVWPNIMAAIAARSRWEQQQQEKRRGLGAFTAR